ncbi:uncharacterized protein L969DRAFT_92457 [Mixia osmundae IAM 14324]|uniref:High-temperature-induced dauer-formation protein-domain-containing protein n=1 Tax=Mixia osmundae (strain CBS 9802 / IAM 14324 / JCM 22182 / KY 12970) TaxID=764103 RepID=G7DXH4_MIXOS|nr:uncharacterized protein L969DRAFT_92457 [Mixia osmundae IAM 14324]KEI41222.1 hypothetical protein L969DRAFT_92457 [Mixia osmundae IAM 14324]GAA95284.1 hypothetical protein E5Q_01940 [Mixia osmundae IAM 14324]
MFSVGKDWLFPKDAKLAFRQTGIAKLATQPVPPEDVAYWEQYWLVFDTAWDVTTLITAADVRTALRDQPSNVKTLISVLGGKLLQILSEPGFPAPTQASLAAGLTAAWGGGTAEPSDTRQLLNCVRVLTRVLPFVWEGQALPNAAGESESSPADVEEFEDAIFWRATRIAQAQSSKQHLDGSARDDNHFVLGADEDEEGEQDPLNSSKPSSPTSSRKLQTETLLPPLGERLLAAVVDMLFFAGLTLPRDIVPKELKISYIIWEAGVGTSVSAGATRELESNRLELLRLLLVLIAKTMYMPTTGEHRVQNKWTEALVSLSDRKVVLSLLCSLLNTSLNNANPGLLNYDTLVLRREDTKSQLASLSLLALDILLVCQDGRADSTSVPSTPMPSLKRNTSFLSDASFSSMASPATSSNTFLHYLSKVHRQPDIRYLFSNIIASLNRELSSRLPTRKMNINGLVTSLIFLWKMFECNPKFREYALEGDKPGSLVVYLLGLSLECRGDPAKLGLIRLCAFILHSLSADRRFGSRLNGSADPQGILPARHAVPGSTADFLVVSIAQLVFTTKGSLNTLYSTYAIILANTSPYWKATSVLASQRLLQLFMAMSAPSFLLAEEGNPGTCLYLLEAFNNVIHYQLSDNSNLVYAILRGHRRFEDLGNFTLDWAVDEIQRSKTAKSKGSSESEPLSRSASARTSSNGSLGASQTSLISPLLAPVDEEKAALAAREAASPVSHTEAPAPPSPSYPPRAATAQMPMSEKALGKQRERTESQRGQQYVSKTGFIPSDAWIASWRNILPLDTISILIAELLPRVSSLLRTGSASAEQSALDYLKTATLVGLLPPPPPIAPRPYLHVQASVTWLKSLVLGAAFTAPETLGVFAATCPRLFTLVTVEPAPSVAQLASRMATSLIARPPAATPASPPIAANGSLEGTQTSRNV